MLLNVKLLGPSSASASCDIEADENDSVESLKAKLETKLKLTSGTEQRLLFKGKPLQDGTDLVAYKLNHGDKLHLMLKEAKPQGPGSSAVTPSAASSASSSSAPPPPKTLDVEEELLKVLKHYFTEEEAKKVARAFKKVTKYNCV